MESKSAESGGTEPPPPGTNGRPFASSPSPLPAQAAMTNVAKTTQLRDASGTRDFTESIAALTSWSNQFVRTRRLPAAVGAGQYAERRTRRGFIGIDLAVAKIPNEQRIAERTEIRRRQGKSPGGIERAAGNELFDEFAIGVVDVNVAQACAVGIDQIGRRYLLGVGHVNLRRACRAATLQE